MTGNKILAYISRIVTKAQLAVPYLLDRLLAPCYKAQMKSCGKKVTLRPLSSDIKGLYNMIVGDRVNIPKRATIFCTEAELIIGSNVILGPCPTLISGDHRTDVVGKYIIDCREKLPSNEAPVIIEDDVWCGANVTILIGCDYRSGFDSRRRSRRHQIVSTLLHYSRRPGQDVETAVYARADRTTRGIVIKHPDQARLQTVMKKNTKVLIVSPARKCRGGITTVIGQIEKTDVWRKFGCRWLETQINTNYPEKLYYFITSSVTAPFIVPRYDIVHFHTTPGMSLLVQMPVFLMAMLWRKKIIVHLHVGNQLVEHADRRVFRFVLRHADRVVVLGKRWKEKLQERFTASLPVEVLYNPAPEAAPLPYDLRTGKYILFTAYLAKNKGYDTLLRAFAAVRRDFPEWRLVIAGAGEIAEAADMAAQLGIMEYVDFPGWVAGQRKRELFANASCFCLASYMEGFPMAVLEAWAYGVPVVTTLVGGLPDVVTENENALTFAPGDEQGLAAQLTRIMRDPELGRKLSANGHETVEKHFDIKKIADQWAAMYTQIDG